jgi:hypothetical protein
MSDMSINKTVQLHRDTLNPFALWDESVLTTEANSQDHLAIYYDALAKTAWFGFMVFSALFTLTIGTLNAYSLPATLYFLIHLYQPYMEATYHSFKIYAETNRNKKCMYFGISTVYQKLEHLSESRLRNKLNALQSGPSKEKPELYLPILAQYTYFKKEMKKKTRELQILASSILQGEVEGKTEKALHLKRQAYFELEESLCIQKVELAYLVHLINHPFDKSKLEIFGSFEKIECSHLCSWQAFHPKQSPLFFKPQEKPGLTREEIKSLSINELHQKIF